MPTIKIAGTDLYYERRGEGEPLLLIQGLGGNSLHWGEGFLGGLADGFELILYDHRGAGRSGALEGELTIADLAADALALLDALEVESAHVVGISMGGMVAQELVLQAPERVRTLTLGCTFPGGREATMTDMQVVGMLAEAVLSGDEERTMRAGYEVMIAAEYGGQEGAYELYCELAGQYRAPIPVLMAQLSAIMGHDTSERLGEVEVPTLVVHGTEDRLMHVSNGELIARLIPGARLELLEGSGHMFFWEQPERSAQLVREHVAAAAAGQS
ncbi:MAG TPA: alpha/beta fold hydrolase [Solirubrobacteraceae bacterium]|nr:alpha/beta fold hydrolase [Solirubrobacteraceae bacterium]